MTIRQLPQHSAVINNLSSFVSCCLFTFLNIQNAKAVQLQIPFPEILAVCKCK